MSTMSQPKVWRYYVPSDNGLEGWGVLFLDDRGCFAALSDWGNYSHVWSTRGLPEGQGMREFLLECDAEYILRKLSPRLVYDEEGTIENLKAELLAWRRDGAKKDKVRELWDEIEEDGIPTSEEAYAWMSRAGRRFEDDAWESIHEVHDRQAVAFVERCWPRLRQCIVDELAAEKARAAS